MGEAVQPIIDYFAKEWGVIWQAPATFLTAIALLGGLIWIVVRGAFAVQIANLRSSLELSDRQIADYRDKLDGKTPDEVVAKLVALESRLASFEPYGWSQEQFEALVKELKKSAFKVFITRANAATEASHVYQQAVRAFKEGGWTVSDAVVWGGDIIADCGLTLILNDAAGDDAVAAMRDAMKSAGIAFRELDMGPNPNHSMLQLLFSSRDPAWKPS